MTALPIRSAPCQACPYRRDVPSGVWSPEDYAKLPPYDAPTMDQPARAFACHATPDHACNGWAIVGLTKLPHDRELLAARLPGMLTGPLPDETVALFDSHTDAADHGLADLADPTPEACDTQARLLRKYDRLRKGTPS